MKHELFKVITFAVPALLLINCGGGGNQDAGTSAQIDTAITGTAVDGHLARATVFIDSNNDGTRNAWESYAFTDNQGYFSYNPVTDTDYCSATASDELAQYCLRSNTSIRNAVIRIDGGYDVLTGEPFYGQLGRRVGLDPGEESVDSSVITPLTTLVINADEEAQETILGSLNLSEEDLDVDYANEDAVDTRLLNAALKVHKTISLLSEKLEENYESIGSEFGVPNDATIYVYDQLADSISESGLAIDLILEDEVALATIVDNAENDIRDLYIQKDLDLPADMGSASNFESFSRTVEIAAELNDVVDILIDASNEEFDFADAIGGAKIIETIVILGQEEQSTVDNAIAFVNDESNEELVAALQEGMSQPESSVAELSDNDFAGSDFDTVEEVGSSASLPEDAEPFTRVGGLQVRVSDLYLGWGPDHLDDSEVELYFQGDAEATSGVIIACAKHIEDAHEDGTLGEGSTRGELLDGYWSLLNTDASTGESYSLLLTFTFLGTTYQSILKPAGMETIENTEYHVLRFDFDGGIGEWHSENGFVETESLPTTSEECEARLPSRIFEE